MRQTMKMTLWGGAILLLGLALSASSQAAQYDLLLKGGHVIDPANHIDRVMDVAVSGGAIVFDPYGLSMVQWQKARKQYYHTPTPSDMSRATADDYPRSFHPKP